MAADAQVGLCDRCTHCKRIVSGRGSVFRMCLLHERDERFAKYPRLPVLQCDGHEPTAPSGMTRA